MAITAGDLLAKASKILQDETNVRWPITTEMLGWLDTVQREAVLLKPNILTATVSHRLVEGTRQTIPADALVLIDVTRNMGADGITPGRAITPISRMKLDAALPDWHMGIYANAIVQRYVYDVKNPKTFYVYPPQPSTSQSQVELTHSVAPTSIANTGTPISLDDIYEGALIDGVLSKAYAKDSENSASAERSTYYRKTFLEALGLRAQVEAAIDPADEEEQPQPTS